jgi:hypothetical protein
MPMQEMDENFHPVKWHPNPLTKEKLGLRVLRDPKNKIK